MEERDVVIIGGGLTGLVTAFWLRKKGIDALIIEKDNKPGGVIRTLREQGFVYETGPNTGVLSHPEVAMLFDELGTKCKLEPADISAKKRLIWKNDRWHPLPSGLMEAIKTPLFSNADKSRILLEPFRKRGKDPFESLESMVKRRLGQSFLDYAIDPFISGIYAGDPSYLVPRYALPKLYALEQKYGSFIRGALMKKLEKKDEMEKKATREVFSVEGGLDNLTGALESEIGTPNIRTGVSGSVVTPFNNGYLICGDSCGKDMKVQARYVISTIGSYGLAELLPFLNGDDLSLINNLRYSGVIQITMGFNKWTGMDVRAFGGLVPSIEKRKILGILFPSSFLKKRAPEEGALLSVFMGGYRNPEMLEMPDERITEMALKETETMMQLDACVPDLLKLHRYKHAIPQYGINSMQRLEAIVRLQSEHRGLILAGNIQEGIGMSDRIRQGKRLAGHIAKAF
jgi:protoporphyrinogen/coproporphyrinogen III oxidase